MGRKSGSYDIRKTLIALKCVRFAPNYTLYSVLRSCPISKVESNLPRDIYDYLHITACSERVALQNMHPFYHVLFTTGYILLHAPNVSDFKTCMRSTT